jgi:AcrR family transcriptional regulator
VANTRERVVTAGAELFRRNGYTGTGMKQIVAAANAPFGSVYHFFPGGKTELGEVVIRWSGGMYLQLVDAIFDSSPDVVTAIRDAFLAAGETLRDTGYADACPIATIALEVANVSEPLRQATADVFESWIVAVGARFAAAGIGDEAARDLAISVIGALEGAFVLCRAMRTTRPLEIAGTTMSAAVQEALPPGSSIGSSRG